MFFDSVYRSPWGLGYPGSVSPLFNVHSSYDLLNPAQIVRTSGYSIISGIDYGRFSGLTESDDISTDTTATTAAGGLNGIYNFWGFRVGLGANYSKKNITINTTVISNDAAKADLASNTDFQVLSQNAKIMIAYPLFHFLFSPGIEVEIIQRKLKGFSESEESKQLSKTAVGVLSNYKRFEAGAKFEPKVGDNITNGIPSSLLLHSYLRTRTPFGFGLQMRQTAWSKLDQSRTDSLDLKLGVDGRFRMGSVGLILNYAQSSNEDQISVFNIAHFGVGIVAFYTISRRFDFGSSFTYRTGIGEKDDVVASFDDFSAMISLVLKR